VARLLTTVQTWNFIDEVSEDYVVVVARYRRSKQNHASSMALLKCKSEPMELTKHVYGADDDELLQFLRKASASAELRLLRRTPRLVAACRVSSRVARRWCPRAAARRVSSHRIPTPNADIMSVGAPAGSCDKSHVISN
jgi:hypothetical protein